MKCKFCGNDILPDKLHPKRKRKFCSLQCMWNLWKKEGRTNYKGERTAQWKGGMKQAICRQCDKHFKFYPSNKNGLFCSRQCSGKYNSFHKKVANKNNPMWKGECVSYRVLHKWVEKHKIKPDKCENCGKVSSELEISNISKKYKRDLDDYWYLCIDCHFKFDWQKDRRDKKGRWKNPKVSPSRIRLSINK